MKVRNIDLLLVLLQKSLWDTPVDLNQFGLLSAEDWREILDLSSRQGVFALVYDGWKDFPSDVRPPRNIAIQWSLGVDSIERRYSQQMEALQSLTQLFKDHGISCLLLKGIGNSLLYPVPSHRECGDLDIYLMGDYEKGYKIISDLGYKIVSDCEKDSHFTFHGVMVENHITFLDTKYNKTYSILETALKKIIQDKELSFIPGTTTYLPTPSFNVLFNFIHTFKHFVLSGINLRSLCDWALFHKHHSDSLLSNDFKKPVCQNRLTPYLTAFDEITECKLNTPFGNHIGCKQLNPFAEKVWEDIISYQTGEYSTKKTTWLTTFINKITSGSNQYRSRWKFRPMGRFAYLSEFKSKTRNALVLFFRR